MIVEITRARVMLLKATLALSEVDVKGLGDPAFTQDVGFAKLAVEVATKRLGRIKVIPSGKFVHQEEQS